MWTRRRFLTTGLLGAVGAGTALAFPDGVRDAMPDGSQAKGMVTEKCQTAIDRGLRYLVSSQGQDGSWGEGTYANNVAVTSLAAMALMAAGNLPGRGPHGYNVKLALEFVMAQGSKGGGFARFGNNVHPDGFLNNPNPNGGVAPQGPMYSHGFGTLFLAEAYGMVADRGLQVALRTAISKAVQIIIQSQNSEGGWRYLPTKQQGDLSVTICQIMALRSARNAGFLVPKSNVDLCVRYVRSSQNLDGSFRYMQNNAAFGFNGPAFARTAAGICAMYSAGIYQDQQIKEGLEYLRKPANRPTPFGRAPDPHYFYGHYYAVQAMWTAGGEYWNEWYPAIREELISRQNSPNGSWLDSVCSHYATAMACIILQVPNQYLPILQK